MHPVRITATVPNPLSRPVVDEIETDSVPAETESVDIQTSHE